MYAYDPTYKDRVLQQPFGSIAILLISRPAKRHLDQNPAFQSFIGALVG
jgi:hypothetical protein